MVLRHTHRRHGGMGGSVHLLALGHQPLSVLRDHVGLGDHRHLPCQGWMQRPGTGWLKGGGRIGETRQARGKAREGSQPPHPNPRSPSFFAFLLLMSEALLRRLLRPAGHGPRHPLFLRHLADDLANATAGEERPFMLALYPQRSRGGQQGEAGLRESSRQLRP